MEEVYDRVVPGQRGKHGTCGKYGTYRAYSTYSTYSTYSIYGRTASMTSARRQVRQGSRTPSLWHAQRVCLSHDWSCLSRYGAPHSRVRPSRCYCLPQLRGYVMVYPNFYNQSSLSTNHLEPGEHVGSKISMHRHLPIDFTVPILQDRSKLRSLWTSAGGVLRPLPSVRDLHVLDHFTQTSSLKALAANAHEAVSSLAVSDTGEGAAGGPRTAPSSDSNLPPLSSFLRGWF
jgi:hypothetical protein